MLDLKINFFKIHFDVNKWLQDRRNRKIRKLQSICPHSHVIKKDGKYSIESLLIRLPETSRWQCQQCQAIFEVYPKYIEGWISYWAKNPEEFEKRIKKFDKLIKKIHG